MHSWTTCIVFNFTYYTNEISASQSTNLYLLCIVIDNAYRMLLSYIIMLRTGVQCLRFETLVAFSLLMLWRSLRVCICMRHDVTNKDTENIPVNVLCLNAPLWIDGTSVRHYYVPHLVMFLHALKTLVYIHKHAISDKLAYSQQQIWSDFHRCKNKVSSNILKHQLFVA